MWFLCFGFFVASSAFPSGAGSETDNYTVQLVRRGELLRQRHSICFPSPLLGQVCLPSAFQFFMPLETIGAGRRRCLSIPIVRAYVVKVCPPNGTAPEGEENSGESFREITQEVGAETERLPDNANVRVNDEEVAFWGGNEESKVEDKNFGAGGEMSRDSEEIEVGENDSGERPPIDKSAEDENISITSNLV